MVLSREWQVLTGDRTRLCQPYDHLNSTEAVRLANELAGWALRSKLAATRKSSGSAQPRQPPPDMSPPKPSASLRRRRVDVRSSESESEMGLNRAVDRDYYSRVSS